MIYLRNILTNAVTAALDPEGTVYRTLIKQRTTAASNTITPDPNVQMEEGSSFTVGPNEPIWEEIPSERAELFANRVLAGVLDAAAAGVDAQTVLTNGLDKDITITAAEYQPNASIKGAATNFRTIEIVAGVEKASPVVAAKLAFEAGDNATAGVETALTLESGNVKVKSGIDVVAESLHSGTGLADPGGIVLVTYTHD